MIKSEPITELSQDLRDHLSLYAKDELDLADANGYVEMILKQSHTMHLVTRNERPVAVVGVVRPTMLGVATFWFLLADDIRVGSVGGLRKLVPKLFQYFPRVETGVEVGYVEGERFAKHFGFTPFGDPYEIFGRVFQPYEARQWHS